VHNFLKALCIVFAIIGIYASICVFCILWKNYAGEKNFKPYASYCALINLAQGFDYYKKQNSVYPVDTNQLVSLRPDLVNDITDGYGRPVIIVPFNEKTGYGALISYGRDGKSEGKNRFDQDIEIRFPMDAETNLEWNNQVGERFKSRTARGL
jgi:hypothetical protein